MNLNLCNYKAHVGCPSNYSGCIFKKKMFRLFTPWIARHVIFLLFWNISGIFVFLKMFLCVWFYYWCVVFCVVVSEHWRKLKALTNKLSHGLTNSCNPVWVFNWAVPSHSGRHIIHVTQCEVNPTSVYAEPPHLNGLCNQTYALRQWEQL